MKELTIGQAAKKSGVKVSTIRYYERIGFIPAPPRKLSAYQLFSKGYRLFSPEIIQRIDFIKHAQQFGFALREIKQLLDLIDGKKGTCRDVYKSVALKITEIEEKITSLRKLRKSLKGLIKTCPRKGILAGCSVIKTLSKENRI
ncbi:MAG: heavy metal-responsive transcriptional regulator [Planctomycetes bacterium]|nr:heavy metal-responsive transcriptional regulator [Planctomycetota bacterium]